MLGHMGLGRFRAAGSTDGIGRSIRFTENHLTAGIGGFRLPGLCQPSADPKRGVLNQGAGRRPPDHQHAHRTDRRDPVAMDHKGQPDGDDYDPRWRGDRLLVVAGHDRVDLIDQGLLMLRSSNGVGEAASEATSGRPWSTQIQVRARGVKLGRGDLGAHGDLRGAGERPPGASASR